MIYLEKLIELSPTAATQYAEGYRGAERHQRTLFSSILTSWARYDVTAALDYLGQIPDQALRTAIASRLVSDPVFMNTPEHARLVDALGPQGEQIFAAITRRQKPPAEQFSDALQMRGQRRSHSLSRAFIAWWKSDPDTALAQLATLEGTDVQFMLPSLIGMIAQQDARLALQIAQTYAPDNHQYEGQALAVLAGKTLIWS